MICLKLGHVWRLFMDGLNSYVKCERCNVTRVDIRAKIDHND